MSLRAKILLILAGVVLLWAAADHLALRRMVTGQFQALGEEEAARGVKIVAEGIEVQARRLRAAASLFASLPMVREAVRDGDRELLRTQLGPATLGAADTDLLYLCDPGGAVLWGRIEAPGGEEEIALAEFPREGLSPHHPLLARRGERLASSLVTTERGILLAAAVPAGEAGGNVVVGRFLDEELRREIAAHCSLPFAIWDRRSAILDPRERELLSQLTSEPGRLLLDADDAGNMHAYETLRDVAGRPDILLRVTIEHGILARGRKATEYLALSTGATALLILLVLVRLLQRTVVSPLGALTRFAERIAATDDTSARTGMKRKDEIGVLAAEFDRMLAEIERSRRLLVETARQAGMSEVAAGVLHNVGNVLNSVNVAANLVQQQAGALPVADLRRTVGVLDRHEGDLARFIAEDPRGRHLLPLLRELASSLATGRAAVQADLSALQEGIEHIAELVRVQQCYAGTKGVFEWTSLAEQVDTAVRICHQAHGPAAGVEIRRDFAPDLPSVRVDRHKLMEILVNLIQNAEQALAESDRPDKQIVLRVQRAGSGLLRIVVEDNGVGIAPLNIDKVFRHGFTTKKGGHGFGLHISANAAREMGAHLHAHSDGPGRGAAFTLDISLDAEASRRAA
ncbi:MAG: ATP-binding protein [Planctomycetota bacterium]